MAAHPLHLRVANGGEYAVFNAGVSPPRSSGTKLQLVGHYGGALAVSDNYSLPLESFTSYHNSMELCSIHRLPTPREGVGQLGRLSGDATAAPTVSRFRGVFAAPIREEQRVRGGFFSRLGRRSQLLRKLDSKSVSLDACWDIHPEVPNLRFSALLREGWALKNHMLWSAKSSVAEDALRVVLKCSGPAVVHP
eukprot:6472631-Amphidinium_carterae.2